MKEGDGEKQKTRTVVSGNRNVGVFILTRVERMRRARKVFSNEEKDSGDMRNVGVPIPKLD